ncbi:hypothetical protein [Quadrisphaera sp. KR29]|uniref:hypothetical protein n=1 Tax=Quadrisphaera sp. KR29 TaxID=3461391 RepID=UPI004044706A
MSGIGLALPVLVLVAACAYALVLALALTAVRSRDLPRSLAAARRYGTTTGVLAVVCGVLAATAVAALGLADRLGSGVTALLVPLGYAAAHTLVLVAGEAGWPRPRGPVRSAVLRARSVARVSSAGWRRLLWSAAAAVLAVGALGAATADRSGRSVTVGPRPPLAEGAVSSSAGPYPGTVFAVPAAVGTALLLVLVLLALHLVASRPAVHGAAAADDAVLRRASAHRVLRGACTGLLATAGGMLVVGGLSLRSAAQPVLVGVDGAVTAAGGSGALAAAGAGAVVVGVVAVAGALAVAHLPAPRLAAAGDLPQPRVALRAPGRA